MGRDQQFNHIPNGVARRPRGRWLHHLSLVHPFILLDSCSFFFCCLRCDSFSFLTRSHGDDQRRYFSFLFSSLQTFSFSTSNGLENNGCFLFADFLIFFFLLFMLCFCCCSRCCPDGVSSPLPPALLIYTRFGVQQSEDESEEQHR